MSLRPLLVHAYDWPIVFVPIPTGCRIPAGGHPAHPIEGAGIPLEAPPDIGRQLMASAGGGAVDEVDRLLAACRQGLRVDRTRLGELRPGWIPVAMALPSAEVFVIEGRGRAGRRPVMDPSELPCTIMWTPPVSAPSPSASIGNLRWDAANVRLFVDLTDLYYVSLLVPAECGVVYATQVGGVVCEQMELTGALLPSGLSAADSDAIMETHIAAGAEGIGADVADQLDLILARSRCETIVVDRVRIASSWEAWVYVTVDPHEEFGPAVSAVLTWCNSD